MTEEKQVKTYTLFKNINNTLEGIEAISFVMWQVALDEADKEGNNIILMSEETCKLIKAKILRLEQENKELKADILKWQKEFSRQYQINENKGYSKTEEKYRSALEKIRSAIIEYLPKKQGDYNFSKSLNPAKYALLEYIQLQINEVKND